MGNENSMENDKIAISMVIMLMNAKRNQYLKENVTNVRSMDTSHQNAKLSDQVGSEKIIK